LKLENRYYSKSRKQQKAIQFLIGLSAFGIVAIFFLVSWLLDIFWLGILTVPVVMSIIAPFFDTPNLVRSGRLKYQSLLFLSEKPRKGFVKVHGGTLFDYVFVMEGKMSARVRRTLILQQFLEGLLNIAREYEQMEEDLVIQGTTYMFSKRNAERIGFMVAKTNFVQKLILLFNFFNVLLTYSIAKRKLSFPRVNETKTFEIKLHDLVRQKEVLNRLNNNLKSRLSEASPT
jgi:hypothetical protein